MVTESDVNELVDKVEKVTKKGKWIYQPMWI